MIFFILTFFSIGVLSDFRKLWQQGFGKLAAVYFVSLFGFVIWVGLLISWLFFSGFKPPLVELDRQGINSCRNRTSNNEINAGQPSRCCPIEKKLIGWSLGIGIALLVVLIAVNHFVPITL